MLKYTPQVKRCNTACGVHLLLRNLTNKLQSGDPSMRPAAVFGDLFGLQIYIQRLEKKLSYLVIRKQQIVSRDNKRQRTAIDAA